MVNRALPKAHHVFFHEEHTLRVTSSDHNASRQTQGLRPDAVGTQLMQKPVGFRFVGECKHINAYRLLTKTRKGEWKRGESLNIANVYSEDRTPETVKSPVQQLFTYMCVMQLKYGFLTTYNTWWFCARRRVEVATGEFDDVLCISEPVTADSTRPTLGEAFALFVATAVLDARAIGMLPSDRVVAQVRTRYESYPHNGAHTNQIAQLGANAASKAAQENYLKSSVNGTQHSADALPYSDVKRRYTTVDAIRVRISVSSTASRRRVIRTDG